MARYRAVVEYDGTGYAGFQRLSRRGQDGTGRPTIQETLERVLGELTGQAIRTLGAGRTDAGVHARGQVIAFDVDWRHGPDVLLRALNARLPASIVAHALDEAPAEFHPRFDARSRTYEYTLLIAPRRPALGRLYVWHRARELDGAALRAGAALIVGAHDFGAFGRPTQGESTVREVLRAEWRARPPCWIFEIEANAFLYRMVRGLTGALAAVGSGELTLDAFAGLLAEGAAGRRRAGGWVAPPQGLCLTQVSYS
jgi:tRNA pseudouridine38-40 synthase